MMIAGACGSLKQTQKGGLERWYGTYFLLSMFYMIHKYLVVPSGLPSTISARTTLKRASNDINTDLSTILSLAHAKLQHIKWL